MKKVILCLALTLNISVGEYLFTTNNAEEANSSYAHTVEIQTEKNIPDIPSVH
ncbi:hypothetical protein AB1K09_00990 [Solibacillus silvestris]